MVDIPNFVAIPQNYAPPQIDFANQLPAIAESYWKGLDEAYKRRNQDAFKGGVPMTPDGNPDYNAIANRTLQLGGTQGIPNYGTLSQLDLARQQLALGQQVSTGLGALENGGRPPIAMPTIGNQPRPQGQPGAGGALPAPPPAAAPVRPPDGTITRVGEDSVRTLAQRAGLPPELADNVAQSFKLDPEAPIRDPKVLQRLQAGFQRIATERPPQLAQYPAGTPNRTQPPTGVDPEVQQQIARLTQIVSNPALPQPVRDAAKLRLEDLQKRYQPTDAQKDYALEQRQGSNETFQQFTDRKDKNKEELQVLEKAVIPRVTASLDKASAARDDILAIHRAREQMDTSPGIISGVLAGNRLDLERFGALFNFSADRVANTEAFRSAIGSRVTSLVKALGSGTAISNSDRVFAEKMAGGQIELNEASIRRILDVGERANRELIQRHDKLVNEVGSRNRSFKAQGDTFKIESPPAYRAPERAAPAGGVSEGATATNPNTGEKIRFQGGKWVPFT